MTHHTFSRGDVLRHRSGAWRDAIKPTALPRCDTTFRRGIHRHRGTFGTLGRTVNKPPLTFYPPIVRVL